MYEGRLIRLRAFERGDVDTNHAFVNDYETLRSMISGIPFPASMEDEYRWLDQQTGYSRGEYQFAVEDFEGYLVGRCGITRVDWKNGLAELAMMIGTPYRGRGYGSEAMELLTDFCFREMNLHKLKVTVFAFNKAAIRCYEKNGFHQEGLLKKEIFRDGAWQDVVIMARFREDGV
ncbi:MAG: GNAT family protein [Clostridia bacterium]|nr:GNAT family protein [Clostridia bacterium]